MGTTIYRLVYSLLDEGSWSGQYITNAEVAQLVEHIPEEDGVAGSNPALGTLRRSLNSKFSLSALVYFWKFYIGLCFFYRFE